MKSIFYEMIQEASRHQVSIFDEVLNVGFNTIIYENGKEKVSFFDNRNASSLVIKNEELFFEKLEEYISLELAKSRKIPNFYKQTSKDRIKWIMTYLFVYATTEDFINPIEYIEKRISFLKDQSFIDFIEGKTIPLGETFNNANLIIKEETPAVSMETSHRISLTIQDIDSKYSYLLPSIYYGIKEEKGEKVCYLYGILKKDNRNNIGPEEQKFINRINRLLYKINQGIVGKDDYNLEGEANLKDVSMSFVFTLNIFISLLQVKGVTRIKAVTYLPVPYLSRELAANEMNDVGKSNQFSERNQNIQTNLTNKFIRTLRRLCAQNHSLEIVAYPYEQDEFLTLSLFPEKREINNELLEDADRHVKNHLGK